MSIFDRFQRDKENSIKKLDTEVAIEVTDLVMEFKVTKDKIDTLKEYVIRTLKRNKKEKRKIRILDGISFKVNRGERVGILGFNGSGKSTLLRIISGIYEPTEGSVKINGKVAPLLAISAGFDKNYTGKNNIFLNGAFLSMDENYLKEKYDEIVEFSELGEFINYPVKNYSKGMQAKLGFSVATAIKPDILILDEVLGVGDIKFKKKSNAKIQSMMKDGVTVLLVSHSIGQIKKICDRCIWIENGKIVMEGEAKKVCDAYVKSSKKKWKGLKMDKRWILIIIIAIIGLSSMYLIVDESMTVGSAITTFSKTTITIPEGFSVEDTSNNLLTLYNKNNNEKIEIYDFGKGNTIKEMQTNITSEILEEEGLNNVTNRTINLEDTEISQTILKNGSNSKVVISYFYKYNHTYSIIMTGYNKVNTTTQDLDWILCTLRPDYKQSQD